MVQMNLFVGRNRDIDVENMVGNTVGKGATNWEIRFDINTLPCVK